MLGTRLNNVLARMALLPEGEAMAYDKTRVSGSKAGTSEPRRVHPLAAEWAGLFRRLLDVAERDLARYDGTVNRLPRAAARNHSERRAFRAAVHGLTGRSPSEAAYVLDCSAEAIRNVRFRDNSDPETGRRRAPIKGPEGT